MERDRRRRDSTDGSAADAETQATDLRWVRGCAVQSRHRPNMTGRTCTSAPAVAKSATGMRAPATPVVPPQPASCHHFRKHAVEVSGQIVGRSFTRSRVCSDDKIRPRRTFRDSSRHQRSQASGHAVAYHRVAHCCRHCKPHFRRRGCCGQRIERPTVEHQAAGSSASGTHTLPTAHDCGEIARLSQPMVLGQHRDRRSGG